MQFRAFIYLNNRREAETVLGLGWVKGKDYITAHQKFL